MTKTADVIVIGSGVIGCAAAYYMAKKGMSHKQIAAGYGVSLVSVDRHLARSGRKKTAKTDKAYSTVPMINSEVKNNRLLINKHEL